MIQPDYYIMYYKCTGMNPFEAQFGSMPTRDSVRLFTSFSRTTRLSLACSDLHSACGNFIYKIVL